MDINKKNRVQLKGRFKKNAIPTEQDFADLIDAAMNQKDDGVAKPPGDALSIEASGLGAHPALKLYDATEANPAWVLNLRVGDPAAGKKGFALTDAAGNARLSIDQPSGALTIGQLTAAGGITANGGLAVPPGQPLSADALSASGMIHANGGLTIAAGQSLSVLGSASVAGDIRMNKSVLSLGTPVGATAAASEVVGAIGFYGFGRSHGQLSYRAGAGFELVDRTADGPSLAYADGSKPYADLKLRSITASGPITASAITAPVTNQDIVLASTGTGAVSLENGLRINGNRSAHVDVDGAFYRTGGQVYLTVDDNLYVRDANAATAAFHFDTNNGRLGVGKSNPACAIDVQGDVHATGTLTTSGGISFDGDLRSENGLFSLGWHDHRTYKTPDGTPFRYPVLQLKGVMLTSDVRARNSISCGQLDVVFFDPVGGGVPTTGIITCKELIANGNKQFQIDHPLDPVHKTLAHASLEGPEIGVYYRGEGRLTTGHAVITLPSYFEALTRKEGRTVMITPRCEADDPISPLAATGIVDGRFAVRAVDSQNPSQHFYWEVKAVRGDVPDLEVEFLKRRANSAGEKIADAK
jgi:hypothetical protein